jgi:hypothetical protein
MYSGATRHRRLQAYQQFKSGALAIEHAAASGSPIAERTRGSMSARFMQEVPEPMNRDRQRFLLLGLGLGYVNA